MNNKIDYLIQQDNQRNENERKCLNDVHETYSKIEKALERNPRAVAEFMGVKLISNKDGGIVYDRDHRVQGYISEGFYVYDSGLSELRLRGRQRAERDCREGR